MTYSWALPGAPKLVPYENPQGRRVNVLAAYRPVGPRPRLAWRAAAKTWRGEDLLRFLRELPASSKPRVVVLDNAGLHTSRLVRGQRPALAREGIYLYYLPPYSPELNRAEAVFRQVKHHGMPRRSFDDLGELRVEVERGFQRFHNGLAHKRTTKLRPCA